MGVSLFVLPCPMPPDFLVRVLRVRIFRVLLAQFAGLCAVGFSVAAGGPADLDTGFGSVGKVTVSPGSGRGGVLVMPDDRVVACGSVSGNVWVGGFLADGAVDGTFGVSGVRTVDFGGSGDFADTIRAHPVGGFIVAGSYENGTSTVDFAIARLDANGSLDTSFSGDGKATVDFGNVDKCYDAAVQADGKVVMVGTTVVGGNTQMALTRLNADGSLDTGFGASGKITINPGVQPGAFLTSVGLLSDGRIVAAGYANFSSSIYVADTRFVVLCYTTGGVLDSSFSGDGIVAESIRSSAQDYAQCLVVQDDDKVVVGGLSFYSNNRNMALMRVNPDGSLDSGFSGDGKLYSTYDSFSQDYGEAVTLDANGKILLAGGANNNFALFRYLGNGALDSSFGSGGKVLVDMGATDRAYGVDLQQGGRIILAGNGPLGELPMAALEGDPPPPPPVITSQPAPVVADALTDVVFTVGVSDPAGVTYQWFKDGVEIPDADAASLSLNSVTTNDDGNYTVECTNGSGTTLSSAAELGVNRLAQSVTFPPIADRYSWTPPFDPGAWSNAGLLPLYSSSDDNVAMVSNNLLVLMGPGTVTLTANHPGDHIHLPAADIQQTLTVLASGPDGTLDAGFGTAGVGSLPLAHDGAVATVVKHMPDGRFVVAGYVQTGSSTYHDLVVARFHPDGSTDNTFGASGAVVHNIGEHDDFFHDMAIQDDGRIVLAGICRFNGYNVLSAVRLLENGALDTEFGTGGWARLTSYVGTGNSAGLGLALEPDGDVLVSGYAPKTGGIKLVVVRFSPSGVLDTSFGVAGEVALSPGLVNNFGRSLAVQPDGRILVCGDTYDGTNSHVLLARLQGNGTPDLSFGGGSGGVVVIPVTSSDYGWEMRLCEDGKIVVVGSNGSPIKGLVMRFMPNGGLDYNFGVAGKVVNALASNSFRYLGCDVSPNGAIYASGWVIINGNYQFLVSKYRPNGTLDTSFGTNGSVFKQIHQTSDYSWSTSLGPDGSLIVVGYSSGTTPPSFPMLCFDGNGGPLAYDAWASENNITGGMNDAGALGLPHIVAYALGVDPASPVSPPFPIEDGRVTFAMGPHAAAMGGLVYGIEVSKDLMSWTQVLPDISDNNSISYKIPEGQECFYARLLVIPE